MKNERRAMQLREIPAPIWALGFVSLLMDVSSEMIHALLPVYLVTGLGASMATVGVIEGMAEATASIVKIFSGALSDWLGKRKLLAVLGYGLAAVTKPVFPLAGSVGWIVAARFMDRVGKGLRGAPRDALVADLSPAHLRGASFGLRQSLDTIGAFVGPAIAIVLMWATANHFQAVFWVAVIPAFLSVGVLMMFVREPAAQRPEGPVRFPLQPAQMVRLGAAFWLVVGVASLFTLARFSEAFLILKGMEVGLSEAWSPLTLALFNLAYVALAYPAGALSDRMSPKAILMAGIAVLVAGNLVLAETNSFTGLVIGVALWGAHMALTQGIFARMIADSAPEDLRATSFGAFWFVSGIAALLASLGAGWLWDRQGSSATFITSAAVAAAAAAMLSLLREERPSSRGA
jgi:MFS family permease